MRHTWWRIPGRICRKNCPRHAARRNGCRRSSSFVAASKSYSPQCEKRGLIGRVRFCLLCEKQLCKFNRRVRFVARPARVICTYTYTHIHFLPVSCVVWRDMVPRKLRVYMEFHHREIREIRIRPRLRHCKYCPCDARRQPRSPVWLYVLVSPVSCYRVLNSPSYFN